ncbi:hypothetical protein Tco_1438675 [Tanacetum coccineum]
MASGSYSIEEIIVLKFDMHTFASNMTVDEYLTLGHYDNDSKTKDDNDAKTKDNGDAKIEDDEDDDARI